MGQPIEALPRPALERRYRRLRGVSLTLGAVVVTLLIVSGLLWAGESGTGDAVPAPAASSPVENSSAPPSVNELERRDPDDTMAIGDVDAPVVLSEWVDLRCPYCAVYSREVFPMLIDEYVDTGKVRIEMHDAAFFGEESLRAAAAARAAGEQGRYVEFVQAVYEVAPESGHPELPVEQLISLAKAAGVTDIDRFTRDMNREDLRADVQRSTDQAQQLGVSGVPFFAVNGQGMSGAQPIEAFRDFLDEAIAAAG